MDSELSYRFESYSFDLMKPIVELLDPPLGQGPSDAMRLAAGRKDRSILVWQLLPSKEIALSCDIGQRLQFERLLNCSFVSPLLGSSSRVSCCQGGSVLWNLLLA